MAMQLQEILQRIIGRLDELAARVVALENQFDVGVDLTTFKRSTHALDQVPSSSRGAPPVARVKRAKAAPWTDEDSKLLKLEWDQVVSKNVGQPPHLWKWPNIRKLARMFRKSDTAIYQRLVKLNLNLPVCKVR